ncbi:hypothetical protein [Chryseobacterium sp. GP-SGM7]|uniref:hypothetical protein n=1 Tax=Chryseobacterium sp. GP-SGM7 TaxID=3411323 RepID=UPI003B935CA8
MELELVYKAIKNWKALIYSYQQGNIDSAKELLEFLNQGSHFSIDASVIKEWSIRLAGVENQFIHVYAGIENNLFKLYLIDSDSDAKGDFSYIVKREFNRKPPLNLPEMQLCSGPPISSESAIYRNFIFNMFCSAWMATQKNDFFRIITVPFDDYKRMELETGQSCICFFGITNEGKESNDIKDFHIELITIKDLKIDSISKTAENYSTPRPPFTATDPNTNYQLLLKSDEYL